MNLLITGGRVIDPSQDLDAKLDVLIEDGSIAKVDKKIKADRIQTIDASGLIVAPGFIDLHTHLREPGQEHKETIATGTLSAVAGGYTAVCAMANTVPPNDERAVTEMVLAEAARNGSCRVYPIGAVSRGLKGEALAELADLRAAGCVAVSDDGKPVYNAQLMRRALEYSSMLGMPVVAHEEDVNLNEGGVMHEGYYSTLLGMTGIPAASEETLAARDVILARMTGGHVHIAHMSTAGAIDVVRAARKSGVRVTCEVTPHHIALTDELVQSFVTDVSNETLSRTTLGSLGSDARVNIERALAVGDRLGGHIVQGHVDTVGTLTSITSEGDFAVYRWTFPDEYIDLVVGKGSIAVDGVSLTIVDPDAASFGAALIPETLRRTNLGSARIGDAVNLEFDMLAKYVRNLVAPYLNRVSG